MVFRQYRALTVLLVLGVIAAGFALAKRHSAERHNRAVEVAVDFAEVEQLAGSAHSTVPEILESLKNAGATTLAVQEITGAELVTSDKATVVEQNGVTRFQGVAKGSLIPLERSIDAPVKGDTSYALALPYGLPKDALDAAKKVGLQVVVRLINYPGVSLSDVQTAARKLSHNLGVKTVVFSSDQVLGFRGSVDEVAETFKEAGLNYGSVEFSKQKGDELMSRKMLPDIIRVHSITGTEMGTLDRPSAIERFVKAAKERNIRLLYVRMFDMSDVNPLQSNVDYVRDITRGITEEGLSIGPSHPFKDPGIPAPIRALIGLGIAAGTMLLLLSIVKLERRPLIAWSIVLAIAFAALAGSGMGIGLKLVALAAAIVFPTLAVLYVASNAPDSPSPRRYREFLWPAIVRTAGAFAISMAGGLMIAALLGRLGFMLHIDQFAGVKLASIAPVLLLAVAFAGGIGWQADTWENQKRKALDGLRRIGQEPVLFWQTALAFVLLIMVALLVMRSGNEPGVGVSPLELKFRSLLDKVLIVRPRTKEFMIGHPALILGAVAALSGRRSWAAVLMVVGAFGEISVLNTLCHIHTPVAISILRGIIGAVVGLIFALVLAALLFRGNSAKRSTSPKNVRRQVGTQK